MAHAILAGIREQLGFTCTEVAAAAQWSRQRYARLEDTLELSVEDVLTLNDLFGVDVGELLDGSKSFDAPVATLLKGQADTLTADTRFAITKALSVARDVRELEEVLGLGQEFAVTRFQEDSDLRHPRVSDAHVRLASQVRAELEIPDVIGSMVRDVTDRLGIVVFRVPFNDAMVEAVSAWTSASGAVIVVNADGRYGQGPHSLRVALAHEVCHLLFDREKMRDVAALCEFDRPKSSSWPKELEPIERRARAFQVELLAPQELVAEAWREMGRPKGEDAIIKLSNRFGLGAVGMKWQLENATGTRISVEHTGLTAMLDKSKWLETRQLAVDESIPVEPMRQGRLLALVRDGWKSGQLSSSWAREFLRLDVHDWEALVLRWHAN